MIRLACVLLLSSILGLAQGQAPSGQPSSDGRAQTAQPATLTPAPVSTPGSITVPAGTKVLLSLRNAISTKSARPGDGVYLRTDFPVAVNNTMAIPVGTYVQGVITSVKRPGRVSGRAEVLFRFTTLIFPDGYTFAIPGALESVPGAENSMVKDKEGTVQADSTKGEDAGKIAAPAATGAVVGAVAGGAKGAGIGGGIGAAVGLATVLLTRGNEVRLPEGTSVEMVFQRPLVIDDVNAHTRYYSGPLSESHRFTIPDRDRRNNGERPVLTPAPER